MKNKDKTRYQHCFDEVEKLHNDGRKYFVILDFITNTILSFDGLTKEIKNTKKIKTI